MSKLKINLKYAKLSEKAIMSYADKVKSIHDELQKNAKKTDEFLGWLELPDNYNKREFEKIKKCAKEIRRKSRYTCSYWHWWFLFRS